MPAHIEVIARGVLIRDGAVLLCRPVDADYRYVPGGHVEFDEAAHEAAAREYLEELNARITTSSLLLTFEQRFDQKGKRRHEYTLMFHVEHATDEAGNPITPLSTPEPAEPDLAFEWWSLERLDQANIRPAELAAWLASLAHETPQPGWLSIDAT